MTNDKTPLLAPPKLASIAALIPVSTAECERAFSVMKHILTDLRPRNRLKISTLGCLTGISIEGPPLSDSTSRRLQIFGVECATGGSLWVFTLFI